VAARPTPERDITPALAQGLLREQAPKLAERELRELARGWELDLPIPAPVISGIPTADFPWHWSVTPFIAGTEAARAELADPASTAETLGRFFAQLHTPAGPEAPVNQYRGVPLAERRSGFETHLANLPSEFDPAPFAAVFDVAAALPRATERVWLHGDLHSRNMVVDEAGHLASIIDWGDICSGDRATDLAGAFMLVPDHLDLVHHHAGASDVDWARARGWAINFAAVYLANSDDAPVMRKIATQLASAVLQAPLNEPEVEQ